MRNLFSKLGLILAAALAVASLAVSAQTYPYQNPTYIPGAVLAPVTISAPGDVAFVSNGLGLVSVRVTGTCTSLAAVVQGSNDATNYTALNAYPIATGASAPVPVASISAVGFWKANVEGMTSFRVHVTALAATCTFALAGKPGGFNGANF